jgi:hypothetical protein
MAAEAKAFDFTNVKERSEFNKKRQPEGDYRGRVTKVEDVKAKDETPQWLFTIEVGRGVYPYYCKHVENQFWKIRNLLIAAGKSVPKKRVKVDPNQVVGREIGVTLEDDEYEGRAQSNIAGVMPLSELDADSLADEEDDAGDDDDDDEAPPPKKSTKKAAVDDDDDEDEEEADEAEEEDNGDKFDAMDRSELKQYIAKNKLDVTVRKSMTDDDLRVAVRAADASDDDDDDLEEIDIDDA